MQRYLVVIAIMLTINVITENTALAQSEQTAHQKYPDVVAVDVRVRGDNQFDFDATISSPYDTPQRYADAFRVMSADGTVYGERKLWHDHAGEQPFARDLYGVRIKSDVKSLIVQARDKKYGYGGKTVTVVLPGR